MTVAEAARVLGIDGSVIRRRLESGAMRGERVHSRLWLIPNDEVERWQQLGKLRPGPKPQGPTAEELRREQAEHQDVLEQGRRRTRSEQSDA